MTGFGPLPLPVVLVLMALSAAVGVAWVLGRGAPPDRARPLISPLVDLLVAGLVAARLAFVIRHLPDYAAEPLSVVMLGDGGYLPLAGMVGAAAFGAWRTRADPVIRKPLAVAALTGVVAWFVLGAGLLRMQRDHLPVPAVQLATLDGAGVDLAAARDRPLVINLWATWCPPCRHELPTLIAAQAAHPEVQFVYVNAGEDAEIITRYLDRSGQRLAPVALDPEQQVARRLGSSGLPTTLFYDADGRLAAVHLGALNRASLAARLALIGAR
jgi:thiol-disulfide isomerase/thioredoxin